MHNSLRQKIQHWIATAGFDAELGQTTAQAVETPEVLNSEFADGVNYNNPRWMAETDALFHTKQFFESTAGDHVTTSGSGTVAIAWQGNAWQCDTGTTSGSHSEVRQDLSTKGSTAEWTWDKPQIARWGAQFKTNVVQDMYIAVGYPGVNNIEKHLGFYLSSGNNGEIHASAADGNAQETTPTGRTNVLGDKLNLQIIYDGDTTATYYIDGAKVAELSGNIPAGGGRPGYLNYYVANSTATNGRIDVGRETKIQLP